MKLPKLSDAAEFVGIPSLMNALDFVVRNVKGKTSSVTRSEKNCTCRGIQMRDETIDVLAGALLIVFSMILHVLGGAFLRLEYAPILPLVYLSLTPLRREDHDETDGGIRVLTC